MKSLIRCNDHSSFCRVGGAFLLLLAFAVSASADYVISVGSDGSTNVNLGLPGPSQSIDFYIGEDVGAGSSRSVSGIVATFNIEAGLVEGPLGSGGSGTSDNATGTVSATGPTGTPGYFGAGNLDISTIIKQSDSSFSVNQVFTNLSQPVNDFTSPDRWFTLNLDTSGLAPGDYSISLLDPDDAFRDSFNQTVPTRGTVSFTIAAVPEPSSFAILAFAGGIVGVTRRVRRSRV